MLMSMASKPRLAEFLWPNEELGPWLVRIWWRLQHGVETPVGFSITSWVTDQDRRASGPHNNLPTEDADVVLPRIDGQFIRSLPMGGLIGASRDYMSWLLNLETTDSVWKEQTSAERDAINSTRRGRDLGDDHYQEVAQVYSDAVNSGHPPTIAVATHFTIAKSSAAKKVARARERGFLPPTSRGRIGPLTEEL